MARTTKEKTQFAETLGGKLRAARGERSYQDVADATGGFVHPRMIQNYEEGTEPRYTTLVVLVAARGLKMSDVVSGEILRASERRDTSKLVEVIVIG